MDWTTIQRRLVPGTVFESRTGKSYRVESVDHKGYTIARTDTGSKVRISAKKVLTALSMLQASQPIKYQATPGNGGISYTVAVTVGAMYPLRNAPGYTLDNSTKTYRSK